MTDDICRITDVAYKVFYDAIEAQGRALLRVGLFILPLKMFTHESLNYP